jgi:transposase
LGSARHLGKPVPGTGRVWTIGGYADDRFHARQSAPLGGRRKRGEQKQAVGRSRGGRNTKIHALADAKGRLLAILLTGGQAHDYPVAKRLIRRVAPPKHMLGDTAYDGDGLREELDQRGTKPVIPNHPNRKHPLSFNKRLYKLRWRIGVSSEGHTVMSVKVRPELKDSGFEAREAPWRESKTAEPSDNMLERSMREASGCNVQ